MMKKIIILNGPNLNLLGEREKANMEHFTLNDIEKIVKFMLKKRYLSLLFFNLILRVNWLKKSKVSRNNQDGLIINAGGYTHTSVAIHDALKNH